MKKGMWAVVTLLGILTIGITAVFTITIMDLVNSKSSEVFANKEEKVETKMEEPIEEETPTINQEDGLSDMEFWTLYNYWNEKGEYGLPEMNIEDESKMRFIGSKKISLGSGVYLSYTTALQHDDELYAPIRIVGEELENYDPEVLAAVFDLVIRIIEGEDSWFYDNLQQNSRDIIKGEKVKGDNHEWKSKITPYEVSFRGVPRTDSSEQTTNLENMNKKVAQESSDVEEFNEDNESVHPYGEENHSLDSNVQREDNVHVSTSDKLYRIQAGVFSSKGNALVLEGDIKKHGIETAIVEKEELYVVYVGAFSIKENADNRLAELQSFGFEGLMKYE